MTAQYTVLHLLLGHKFSFFLFLPFLFFFLSFFLFFSSVSLNSQLLSGSFFSGNLGTSGKALDVRKIARVFTPLDKGQN